MIDVQALGLIDEESIVVDVNRDKRRRQFINDLNEAKRQVVAARDGVVDQPVGDGRSQPLRVLEMLTDGRPSVRLKYGKKDFVVVVNVGGRTVNMSRIVGRDFDHLVELIDTWVTQVEAGQFDEELAKISAEIGSVRRGRRKE